ncbi:hypothetical protein SDC9_168740 [bioreactor metagenome]|uniref:Uncharacterized protein n=1 Tax=bioreactor metagenome TaxID=1076179 RepID=A0A645G3C4_9ZZZZ
MSDTLQNRIAVNFCELPAVAQIPVLASAFKIVVVLSGRGSGYIETARGERKK